MAKVSWSPDRRMQLKSEELLGFVIDNIELTRNEIVAKAGYLNSDGGPLLSEFYNEFTKNSLGFPEDRYDDWELVSEFLHEKGGGCSPMLENGKIVGRHGVRISDIAKKYDWDEVDWDDIKDEEGEGHLDSPYEVQKSTSYGLCCYNNYSLEDACDEFGGQFADLLRASYDCLGDDENGQDLNQFLDQYEEHPRHYIEIAHRLGWFSGELPWG